MIVKPALRGIYYFATREQALAFAQKLALEGEFRAMLVALLNSDLVSPN